MTPQTTFPDEAPLTLGTGRKVVAVVAGRDLRAWDLNAIVRTAFPVLEDAAPGAFTLTECDPCGRPWFLAPYDFLTVWVTLDNLRWVTGYPGGLCVTRPKPLGPLQPHVVYVSCEVPGKVQPQLDLAAYRLLHEAFHYYSPNPNQDDDHADDPNNVMYRGGVRVGSRFYESQKAVLRGA